VLNARDRLALLKMLDALEPSPDGISVAFTLAPLWTDSEDYRLGWMACASEIKSVLLPMLGFAREYWDRRRKSMSKASAAGRAKRLALGMCAVATCDQRATDGDRCEAHANARRDAVAQRNQERRDRARAALADRARLQSLRPERWCDADKDEDGDGGAA